MTTDLRMRRNYNFFNARKNVNATTLTQLPIDIAINLLAAGVGTVALVRNEYTHSY